MTVRHVFKTRKKREINRHYSFMLIPQHQVKEKIYKINLLGLIYRLSAYELKVTLFLFSEPITNSGVMDYQEQQK